MMKKITENVLDSILDYLDKRYSEQKATIMMVAIEAAEKADDIAIRNCDILEKRNEWDFGSLAGQISGIRATSAIVLMSVSCAEPADADLVAAPANWEQAYAMQENLICIIYNEKLYCTCRKTYRDDALWNAIEKDSFLPRAEGETQAQKRWDAGEEGKTLKITKQAYASISDYFWEGARNKYWYDDGVTDPSYEVIKIYWRERADVCEKIEKNQIASIRDAENAELIEISDQEILEKKDSWELDCLNGKIWEIRANEKYVLMDIACTEPANADLIVVYENVTGKTPEKWIDALGAIDKPLFAIWGSGLWLTDKKKDWAEDLYEALDASKIWEAGEEEDGPQIETEGKVLNVKKIEWCRRNPEEVTIKAVGRADWESDDTVRAYAAVGYVTDMTGKETIEEIARKITGLCDIESTFGPGQKGAVALEFSAREERDGEDNIEEAGDASYPGFVGTIHEVAIDYEKRQVTAWGWCRPDDEDTEDLTRQFMMVWMLREDNNLTLHPSAGEALKATDEKAIEIYVEGQGEYISDSPEEIAARDKLYFEDPGELICVPGENRDKIRARLETINIRNDGKYEPNKLDIVADYFAGRDWTRFNVRSALRLAGYRQDGEKWESEIFQTEDDEGEKRVVGIGYAGRREIIMTSPALENIDCRGIRSIEIYESWDPNALDFYADSPGRFIFCLKNGEQIPVTEGTPRQALQCLEVGQLENIAYLVAEWRGHNTTTSIWPCEGLDKPCNQAP
jgi:hypothetical protein